MEMKELLIILVVALVVFGSKKLRSVGEDLGQAVRGFKRAMDQGESEERNAGSAPRKLIRSEGADTGFVDRAQRIAEPASKSGRAA